jgi:carbonic anhydrase
MGLSQQEQPDEAIEALLAGNRRYAAGKAIHPHQSPEHRREVASAQHPAAIVLSCSDSRVPPEIVFDQGLGDLFVVRTAGHVVDDVALASLEYAVEHLGVTLLVVLGHSGCGAVAAAIHGGEHSGHLGHLVELIRPAVERAKEDPGDLLDRAVRENVAQVVAGLRAAEPVLAKRVRKGELAVVGARYDLQSGLVELLF